VIKTDEIELEYLKQILEFKNKKELNEGFLDEEQRDNLLKEVIDAIDLDENFWRDFKCEAYKNYHIYSLFKRDGFLKNRHPKLYNKQISKYLKKALDFNPFNVKILKEYITFHQKNVDVKLKKRYLTFFHPNSIDYQKALIWLELDDEVILYDYLSDDITKPIVSWIVEHKKSNLKKSLSTAITDELAKADVDEKTIEESKDLVNELLRTTAKVFNASYSNAFKALFLEWDDVFLSKISIDKALKLAPYNKNVLKIAIEYYGSFYWRLLFNANDFKQQLDKRKQFNKTIFKTQTPTFSEVKAEARQKFDYAVELNIRLKSILDNTKRNKHYSTENFKSIVSQNHVSVFKNINNEYDYPCYCDGVLEKEAICFQVFEKNYIYRKSSDLIYVLIFICSLVFSFSIFHFILKIPFLSFIKMELLVSFFSAFLITYGLNKIIEYFKK